MGTPRRHGCAIDGRRAIERQLRALLASIHRYARVRGQTAGEIHWSSTLIAGLLIAAEEARLAPPGQPATATETADEGRVNRAEPRCESAGL
jgi:hypothetical protein